MSSSEDEGEKGPLFVLVYNFKRPIEKEHNDIVEMLPCWVQHLRTKPFPDIVKFVATIIANQANLSGNYPRANCLHENLIWPFICVNDHRPEISESVFKNCPAFGKHPRLSGSYGYGSRNKDSDAGMVNATGDDEKSGSDDEDHDSSSNAF